MSKFKGIIKSPHVQIALVTGFSIIIMAWFSKKIIPNPISYLGLAFPPFIATIYEAFLDRYKDKKIMRPFYWIIAILIATALMIILHWD